MVVDDNKFKQLREEVEREQNRMPIDSLDWYIYKGQLELLDKVSTLSTTARPTSTPNVLVAANQIDTVGAPLKRN